VRRCAGYLDHPVRHLTGHSTTEYRQGLERDCAGYFFFRQSREIILTNGYVKKQQKVDTGELERARSHKKDWEQRHT